MKKAFTQGALDCLCGIYSIVNADKIVNKSSSEESQNLFNAIIHYLNKKRILKDTIIEGVDHRLMSDIMHNVVGNRIPLQLTNRKSFRNIKEWWSYSKAFLEEGSNRAIILSIGGNIHHLTVIQEMSERRMILLDSSWSVYMKKSDCRLPDYQEKDRYIIYPAQCFYLGKSK